MSHGKSSYDDTQDYTDLFDLNLLGFLCGTGREWTLTISKESLTATNQSLEERKLSSTRSLVLLGTLASLLLLGGATLPQTTVGSQAPQVNLYR
ncbi:MAG: hypothetical protein AB1589_28255 [Cyanobacteriota bacterium]